MTRKQGLTSREVLEAHSIVCWLIGYLEAMEDSAYKERLVERVIELKRVLEQ